MSPRRVLLVGYYGKGNFGDDVLLKTSYNILRQAMPDAQIYVIVAEDAGTYVPEMLPDATVLKPGRHGKFDLIVHGGGGVYFDFKPHGWRNRLLEKLMQGIGTHTYITLEKFVRMLFGKVRSSAQVRLGWGIGVGTYTLGSPRLRASLPILADYKALWVRDEESVENLKRFSTIISGDIIAASDLAFLTDYWMTEPVMPRAPAVRPRLGIILRDWEEALGGLPETTLRETIAALAVEYDITGFILDRQTDPQLQYLLAHYTTCIWQPEDMCIATFTQRLAQQDVLLTSRAHGAICGACVGVPSVIVTIEPKLQQVAVMLSGACKTVAANEPHTWSAALQQARSIAPDAIHAAVEKNRVFSTEALASMQRWLV